MRKKILSACMIVMMVLSLVGCGSDKSDDSSGVVNKQDSTETEVLAFKEYYEDYCKEHYCELSYILKVEFDVENYDYNEDDWNTYEEYEQYLREKEEEYEVINNANFDVVPYMDCAAKIEICNGSYVMIIADMVDYMIYEEDEGTYSPIYDIVVCIYDNGVKELCKIEDFGGGLGNEGHVFAEIFEDNVIIAGDDDGFYLVSVSDGSYEKIEEDEQNNVISEDILFQLDDDITNYLIKADDGFPVLDVMNEELFENWLEFLNEQEFKDSLELAKIYAQYLCDNHIAGESYKDLMEAWGYSSHSDEIRGNSSQIRMIYPISYDNGVFYKYYDDELLLYPEYITEEALNEYNYGEDYVDTLGVNKPAYFVLESDTDGESEEVEEEIDGITVYRFSDFE